jgi:hypothetical protein
VSSDFSPRSVLSHPRSAEGSGLVGPLEPGRKQGRSVNVDFGVVIDAEDNTDYRIKTDPEIHAEKATAAHKAFSREWKGLIRMVKYWNNNPRHGEKPIKPSSLVEVMGLECLFGEWQGWFDYELQALFLDLG